MPAQVSSTDINYKQTSKYRYFRYFCNILNTSNTVNTFYTSILPIPLRLPKLQTPQISRYCDIHSLLLLKLAIFCYLQQLWYFLTFETFNTSELFRYFDTCDTFISSILWLVSIPGRYIRKGIPKKRYCPALLLCLKWLEAEIDFNMVRQEVPAKSTVATSIYTIVELFTLLSNASFLILQCWEASERSHPLAHTIPDTLPFLAKVAKHCQKTSAV